jgi:hypothetical protein
MSTLVGILRWKFIYGNWTKTINHITVKQEITYASFWVVERILGWIIKRHVDTQ